MILCGRYEGVDERVNELLCDPLTPYSWAQAVARQFGNARLLTRDGPGHTAYFNSTCVQTWTYQFFGTLALPPKGTVCNSNNPDVIEP